MRVFIKDNKATFDSETGAIISITTDQLIEMFRILSLAVKEDDGILFETLEFTV